MVKKLIFLLLSFAVLLPSFLTLFSHRIFAFRNTVCSGIGVNFSFNPALTDGLASTDVTIHSGENMPTGSYKLKVILVHSDTISNVSGYDYDVPTPQTKSSANSDITFPGVTSVRLGSNDGKFHKGDVVWFVPFRNVNSPNDGDNICHDPETISAPNPVVNNCNLKILSDLKPSSGIVIQAEGLGGDPQQQRGVVLKLADPNGTNVQDLTNWCATNSELSNSSGYQVHTNSTDNYLSPGYYNVVITEGCLSLFTKADGAAICNTPYFVKVDASCAVDTATQKNSCDYGTIATQPVVTLAPPCPNPDANGFCPSIQTAFGPISTAPQSFLKNVLGLILSLAGGILVLTIIASGYRMMTSQGDPEKIKEARDRLTSGVVGLLFIVFSFIILQFITVDILHLPGFSQ